MNQSFVGHNASGYTPQMVADAQKRAQNGIIRGIDTNVRYEQYDQYNPLQNRQLYTSNAMQQFVNAPANPQIYTDYPWQNKHALEDKMNKTTIPNLYSAPILNSTAPKLIPQQTMSVQDTQIDSSMGQLRGEYNYYVKGPNLNEQVIEEEGQELK